METTVEIKKITSSEFEKKVTQTLVESKIKIDKDFQRIERQVENLRNYRNKLDEAFKKIDSESFLSNIEKGLRKIGFELISFDINRHHYQGSNFPNETGGFVSSDVDYSLDKNKIKLTLEVKLKMVGNRHPLKSEFSYRYTTKSEQKRFENKNRKDEAKFFDLTGFKISINRYSLHKSERALATIYC